MGKLKKKSGGERWASLLAPAWTPACRPDAGVFGLQVHDADPLVTLFPNQAVGMKLWDWVQRRHQLDHHPGRTLIIIDLEHIQDPKGQVLLSLSCSRSCISGNKHPLPALLPVQSLSLHDHIVLFD